MRMVLILAGLFGLVPAVEHAAAEVVDLELVLAVDVSTSVDGYEAALQRDGYVTAITDPAVVAAVRSGPNRRIAVIYVEWAGEFYQHVVVDWRIVDGRASAEAFSQALAGQPITTAPSTSISGLLDFARREIMANGYQGLRAVVDISGDGPNSSGRPVRAARDDAVSAGITINGLPILTSRRNPDGSAPATGVKRFYIGNVIGGPGAFVLEVSEFESVAATLIEKLVREIRGDYAISQYRPGREDFAPPDP